MLLQLEEVKEALEVLQPVYENSRQQTLTPRYEVSDATTTSQNQNETVNDDGDNGDNDGH
jgi:hypothetical protein